MYKKHYVWKAFLTLGMLLASTCLVLMPAAFAQNSQATITGTIMDPGGAVVPNVHITLVNLKTNARRVVTSNKEGAFAISQLEPGKYKLQAHREGFALLEVPDIVLNTADRRDLQIKLQIAKGAESITVVAAASIETDMTTGQATAVDSKFIRDMPLKGRSFQSLLLMTPGVVAAGGQQAGQLSFGGLRTNANYWTIDGVSANVGIGSGNNIDQTSVGSIPGFNSYGATSSLISVDALEEFKVQTSAYSAEYGRQPGGQVQLTTRSGGNQFHGTAFDYFRNEAMEANDWFNNHRKLKTPRPRVRQNDFGGTFSGPLIKDRTFFFFTYEGMRLRLPMYDNNAYVPTIATRNNLAYNAELRALMNAFPVSNLPEVVDANGNLTGMAPYSYTYSQPKNMDTYSVRMDHKLNSTWNLFGRYNQGPSHSETRDLVSVIDSETSFQTLTVGVSGVLSPNVANQLTFNYSHSNGSSFTTPSGLNGAIVPPVEAFFGGIRPEGKTIYASWNLGGYPYGSTVAYGNTVNSTNRQINVVDGLSWAHGKHSLKFGGDFRYLYPRFAPSDYNLAVTFNSLSTMLNNTASTVNLYRRDQGTLITKNLSLYAQDSWRATSRLTVDLGVRWELNPPPHGSDPLDIIVVRGWQNPATMDFAPEGTSAYETIYGAFAPRAGFNYQVSKRSNFATILKGGWGLFYDLGPATAGYSMNGMRNAPRRTNVSLPFSADVLAPPAERSFPTPPYGSYVGSFSFVGILDGWVPPRTQQWNLGIQQELGKNNILSVSWVGNAARRLPRSYSMTAPPGGFNNPNFPNNASILVTRNDNSYGDSSDYEALQVQYQRRLSHGLQILSNYTWSHAIDTDSDDTDVFNWIYPTAQPDKSRGNSAFDRRQTFNVTFSYQLPNVSFDNTGLNLLSKAFLKGWQMDTMFKAQSGTPINVYYGRSMVPYDSAGGMANLRVDRVPGVPLWLDDPAVAGGRKLNPNAFAIPASAYLQPQDAKQGNLSRNSLFGPGMWQVDMSIGREFKLNEQLKLQFRGELYNAFNHPNFTSFNANMGTVLGDPAKLVSSYDPKTFGQAWSMLGGGGGGGAKGMLPLYSTGGPRSVQLALKLIF